MACMVARAGWYFYAEYRARGAEVAMLSSVKKLEVPRLVIASDKVQCRDIPLLRPTEPNKLRS